MKPLFIPLTGKYYDAFINGNKDTEYRLHGPRWNLKTCVFERQVILSRGYGKQNRVSGFIDSVKILKRSELNFQLQQSMREIYRLSIGDNPEIIAVGITLTNKPDSKDNQP